VPRGPSHCGFGFGTWATAGRRTQPLAVLDVGRLRYRFATAVAAADPTTAAPASGHRQVAEFLAGKNGHESLPHGEIIPHPLYDRENDSPPAIIEIVHILERWFGRTSTPSHRATAPRSKGLEAATRLRGGMDGVSPQPPLMRAMTLTLLLPPRAAGAARR
jgi:hypothetical protein